MNDSLKLILHMGSPKTGTTSLQHGLHAIRSELANAGIFYPVSPWEKTGAHHILTALFGDWDNIKPVVQRNFHTLSEAHQAARDFISSARTKALETGCHTVLLSSELVFPNAGRSARDLLSALRTLTMDIQPVVYAREPADLYRSRLQQESKGGAFYPPHVLLPYRRGIEDIEQAFGVRSLVRPYDRDQLIDGDIVSDFCKAVLKLDLDLKDIPKFRENVSLSAEATFLLIAYGKYIEPFSGERDRSQIAAKHRAVIRTFVDSENRLTKLKLKPDLEALLRSTAVEYKWLQDRYGIRFECIDYENIHDDFGPLKKFAAPSDIFDINSEALAWLSAAIMQEISAKKPRKTLKPRNAGKKGVEQVSRRLTIPAFFAAMWRAKR